MLQTKPWLKTNCPEVSWGLGLKEQKVGCSSRKKIMIITRKEKEYNSKNNLIPEKAVREKYFGLWNISQMQRIKQQWLRVDWVQPYLWPPQQSALPDLEQEQSTDLYHKHISWTYNNAAFMEKLGNKKENVIRNENLKILLSTLPYPWWTYTAQAQNPDQPFQTNSGLLKDALFPVSSLSTCAHSCNILKLS